MTVRWFLAVTGLLLSGTPFGIGAVTWPTANTAFVEEKPYKEFVQPTVSNNVASGLFGCVRSDGKQFHEGLDLFPVERNSRHEPADGVYAILPGVVRYANRRAGNSSYGNYVVIEHTGAQPAFVSLYAHLASIGPAIRPGLQVEAGQQLGIMGRSAGGYSIPRERAHLHLEFGVWLSREFPNWYSSQRYQTKNQHGLFNGYNIVGLDFLDFVERERAGEVSGLLDYVDRLPVAVTIEVKTRAVPDFVKRYPDLVHDYDPAQEVAGWKIDFTWFGLPKSWSPIMEGEPPPKNKRSIEILFHDAELLSRYPCHNMVRVNAGHVVPGARLQQTLSILFSGL